MNEGMQLVVWGIKILVVIASAVMYRFGGWHWKPFRRFIMPTIYIAVCNTFALINGHWSPLLLIPLPLFMGALSLGYGADTLWKKIIRRVIVGSAVAVAFLPFGFATSLWALYALHCLLSIFVSVGSGVWNQYQEGAAGEEATIGLSYTLFPIMMI